MQLVAEINAEIPAIDGAYPASLVSIGSANYKGDWAALSGALNIPAACSYGSRVWLLASNLANVASATPGVSPAWLDITPTKGGFKNRIINGGMQIDQRNAGAVVTPVSATYTLDRWNASVTQPSKLAFQQVTDAPAGANNSLKVSVAAQYSPILTDIFTVYQAIEGNNVVDLQFGTAGALTITTSFQVKSSITGTFSVAIGNGALSRSYVATYSIAAANTWTPLVITIAGDQSGTWATDNTVGLYLSFDLGYGSNFNNTAGSWLAGIYRNTAGSVKFVNQTAGSTWQLAQVQLESGSMATSFDVRSYAQELALCQRYYEKSYNQATRPGTSGSTAAMSCVANGSATNVYSILNVPFKATKRTAPTICYWDSTGNAGMTSTYTCGGLSQTDNVNAIYGTSVTDVGFSSVILTSASMIHGIHYAAVAEL